MNKIRVLSENRDFVMGIAILWIMLYHIPVHTELPVLKFLQDIGYGGVDLFVLLSGFGCYYSLEKDDDILRFFGRRLKRLLPSYLPFIIIWMIVRFVTGQLYFTEIFGNLTMSGWWNGAGNQFNWYVDAIVFFYLLAPYLCAAVKKSKKPYLTAFLLLILTLAVSIAFMHGLLLIAISRLPVFVTGIFFARLCYGPNPGKELLSDRIFLILLNLIMFAGFAAMYYFLYIQTRFDKWHYGLWWYPFLLIAPGLSLDMSRLGELLSKTKVTASIKKGTDLIGRSSFEIFLVHLFIFETLGTKEEWRNAGALKWCAVFAVALFAGCIYGFLIRMMIKKKEAR